MTTIKASTKKGENMMNRANYNEGYNLWEVYGRCSAEKQNAWDECLAKCDNENGYNFRIISHNTFSFSVACDVINLETGEFIGVRIETANNSYFVTIA